MRKEVDVPYNWEPRDYQIPLWSALESGVKRAVAVWHRRAGKDVVSLNWTIRESIRRPGLYWHILPTYNQGRKIVWNGMTRDGRKFVDYFPPETIVRTRDDDMTIWLQGDSLWQVVGTDDVDRLVGANPVGCVFSEYSLQNPKAWAYLRPILAENGGWALFIYTPRGRNHGHKLLKMAEDNPKWFAEVLTANDTGAITEEAIEEERLAGMPEELVQQEFYCSFDAPLVGSYYGDLLTAALKEGRIGKVPYDPRRPVDTAWDLGFGDATAIWFVQQIHTRVHFIDYYQASGMGLDHYAKILREKPYAYDRHYAPHDAQAHWLGTGESIQEVALGHGIPFTIVPKLSVADGINAVRMLLPRSYFSDEKTGKGVEALRQYTKERLPNEEGPDGEPVYRDKPKHDWTSHAADSIRTYAVGRVDADWGGQFEQPSARWVV